MDRIHMQCSVGVAILVVLNNIFQCLTVTPVCMCVKYLFVCRHVVLYISIYTLTYWLCGYSKSNW